MKTRRATKEFRLDRTFRIRVDRVRPSLCGATCRGKQAIRHSGIKFLVCRYFGDFLVTEYVREELERNQSPWRESRCAGCHRALSAQEKKRKAT